jgi:hypothetical protein
MTRATDIPVGSRVRLTSQRSKRCIVGTYKGWGWNERDQITPTYYLIAVTQTVVAHPIRDFDLEIL